MKKILIFLTICFLNISCSVVRAEEEGGTMKITSTAFAHNTMIPKKYTCQGSDINPPLEISRIPEAAKSLVLIVDDPDAPGATWVHWVVYNIPVSERIAENSVPGEQGENDFGKRKYGGPCPPGGTHRYFFKIYALDTTLASRGNMTKKDLEYAMKPHILAEAELIGLYKKS